MGERRELGKVQYALLTELLTDNEAVSAAEKKQNKVSVMVE
jgi:hypothetical protein